MSLRQRPGAQRPWTTHTGASVRPPCWGAPGLTPLLPSLEARQSQQELCCLLVPELAGRLLQAVGTIVEIHSRASVSLTHTRISGSLLRVCLQTAGVQREMRHTPMCLDSSFFANLWGPRRSLPEEHEECSTFY